MTVTYNKVVLMGNLGRTPVVTVTLEGKKHATFSLATHRTRQSGGWVRHTDWHNVVVFHPDIIERVVPTLSAGDIVFLEGALSVQEEAPRRVRVTISKNGMLKKLSSRPVNDVSEEQESTPLPSTGA